MILKAMVKFFKYTFDFKSTNALLKTKTKQLMVTKTKLVNTIKKKT